MGPILNIVIALVLMGIILYLFYFVTKYLGKKVIHKKGELMRIVDVLPLSSDSFIILIEISDKLLLVGKTQNSITYLTEFNKSEIMKEEKRFEEILSEKKESGFDLKNKINKLYNIFKDDGDGE